jgi:hypothetical protein
MVFIRLLKQSVWAISLCLAIMPAGQATEVVDRLGIPGPVTYDGQRYDLSWSSQLSPGHIRQEYVPAGQKPENYTSMVLIDLVTTGKDANQLVASMIALLKQRKQTDPIVNFDVFQNDKKTELMLDFVLSSRDSNRLVVEWNAYRYVPYRDADGKTAVLMLAISERGYNDQVKDFLSGLKTRHPGKIEALGQQEIPKFENSP